MNMLKARYSTMTGFLKCGVAQGDPLSTYLFILSIDPIVRELSQEYQLVAYADDILIGIHENEDPTEVIDKARRLFAKIGQINDKKCKCTNN